MALRAWLPRTLAALLLAIPLPAFGAVTLEVKIPDGDKSTTEVKIKTEQTLNIADTTNDTGSEQEMTISTVNGQRNAEGVIRQEQKIEAMRSKISLPGGITLQYDSTQPNAPPPGTQFDVLLDLIKANAKSTWTVVRGKDNRVIAIEGRDKVLEGLAEPARAMLQKQLDPIYLRDVANKEFDKLPSQPVEKGDTWEVAETLRLEQGQNMSFKTKLTYQGEVERDGRKLDHIQAEILEVNYTIDADASIPLKVVSAELKPEASEGSIYFDREKGTIVENVSSVHIKGTITFELNGTSLPAQLDLKLSSSSITK